MDLKDKMKIDKQLSLNFNCKHKETEMREVYRADSESEPAYPQVIRVCKKCRKEII